MSDDDVLGTRRDERDTLVGFLDWYRAVIEHKVEGLSREDATRVMTPSGLSLLGIVQHLAYVSWWWFRHRLTGEDFDRQADPEDDFFIDPSVSIESVLAFYRAETDRAREIALDGSLDDLSVLPHHLYGHVTRRWVLVHVIEETARHAGHLDLMREQIDGRTGD